MNETASDNKYRLNADQIRKYLPHRFPFLLIDRILEIHPKGDLEDLAASRNKVGIKVKSRKNVTVNEPFMQGHFPDFSVMPGVLILEAMAQTACFSLYPYMLKDLAHLSRSFKCVLIGSNNVRFRQLVVPGDTLEMESEVTKCREKIWVFNCSAKVGGKVVAQAEIMANLIPAAEITGRA